MTCDELVRIMVKRKLTGVIDFDPVSIDGDLVAFRIIKISVAEGIDDGFLHGTNWNLWDLDPCVTGKISAPVDVFFGVNFAPFDQIEKRAVSFRRRFSFYSGQCHLPLLESVIFSKTNNIDAVCNSIKFKQLQNKSLPLADNVLYLYEK